MKKLRYFVLIFSTFLGVGCEKDTPFFDANSIIGSWSLSEANLGWGGYESYESNQIVWKFETDQQLEVTVQEGLNVNQNIPFSNSQLGVYPYLTSDSTLLIDGQLFHLLLENNLLIIDQNPALDGIQLSFSKNE